MRNRSDPYKSWLNFFFLVESEKNRTREGFDISLGLRKSGNPQQPVSLPGTFVLFGSGLLFLRLSKKDRWDALRLWKFGFLNAPVDDPAIGRRYSFQREIVFFNCSVFQTDFIRNKSG